MSSRCNMPKFIKSQILQYKKNARIANYGRITAALHRDRKQ
jgi:hypothetical protein